MRGGILRGPTFHARRLFETMHANHTPGGRVLAVDLINPETQDVLAAVKAALDAQGLTVVGGSAADFKRVLDAEARRWGPIITRIGVKLD